MDVLDKMEKVPTGKPQLNILCMPDILKLLSGHGASTLQQLAMRGLLGGQKSLVKYGAAIHGLGQVLHCGLTLEALCAGASDRPQQEIKISKITVHANPLAD